MHRYIGLLFSVLLFFPVIGSESRSFPVSYQGRIRPAEAYARLWLYDFYHSQSIKKQHQEAFKQNSPSALTFIWNLHFRGYGPFKEAPLFFISSAAIKQMAGLPTAQQYFSYQMLHQTFYENQDSYTRLAKELILYHASKPHGQSRTFELANLSPGLWVRQHPSQLIMTAVPDHPFWKKLHVGQSFSTRLEEHPTAHTMEEISHLLTALQQFEKLEGSSLKLEQEFQKAFERLATQELHPKEIQQRLEKDFPLIERLRRAGSLLMALPSRYRSEEWFSLHALKCQVYDPSSHALKPVGNFTVFSDDEFHRIRQLYFQLEEALLRGDASPNAASFTASLNTAYAYWMAQGRDKALPTLSQLWWESTYYQYPFTWIIILLYGLAILCMGLKDRLGLIFLGCAFLSHTALLLLRCYILGRPPVSNMFETLLYVPWVASGLGFILYYFWSNRTILIASSLASPMLLLLLELTHPTGQLENIQPVLNSQFWLIIHVLMVVGSYGVFFLSSLLGHFYLIQKQQNKESTHRLFSCILQSMYLGTALLILGTILGGVWAAESWGRFWDWDPKEAWAFISSCVYLIWIHAYRFNKIAHFGLALGSIIGFLFISFTWYGVNYLLGTGLHSYGFGLGGEKYYYLFIFSEACFMAYISYTYSRTKLNLSR